MSTKSYKHVVEHVKQRLDAVADDITRQMGKLSIWIRFVKEELYDGSPVEMTQGSTTRIIMEAHRRDELLTSLAENIVLKVFGEELQLTNGIPELVFKLFNHKYYLKPEGPYADSTTDLKLKITVYEYRPDLFEKLFSHSE